MNNNITINPKEILLLPDNSITDGETIRQIALYSIKTLDSSLNKKIKKGFEFAGLYPHVMNINNITLNKSYKISFDFDNTLDKEYVQRLVKVHQNAGDIVYIVTSRIDKIFDNDRNFIGYVENTDLYKMAEKLGISKENIHFTNQQLKLDTLIKLGISMHYDDDVIEIDEINRSNKEITGILINYKI